MNNTPADIKAEIKQACEREIAKAAGQEKETETSKTKKRKLTLSLEEIVIRLRNIDATNEKRFKRDDIGFSSMFSDAFSDLILFNTTVNDWMIYDGTRWTIDESGKEVKALAKDFSRALLCVSGDIQDDKDRVEFSKEAGKYSSLKKRKDLVTDSESNNFKSSGQLDADDDLLNLLNGTYNLNTGEFAPHDSGQFLSIIGGAAYDPQADCPRWTKFISEIMEGDNGAIDFLQRLSGYLLTAETREEAFFLLLGLTTRNGKSTYVDIMSRLMGGYATALPVECLAIRKMDGTNRANDAIARLEGKRFICVSEPPKNYLMDAALIKSMSGGDSITARSLYEKNKTFKLKAKIVIHSNYQVPFSDLTIFDSGRLYILPFNRHFSEAEQDKDLKQTLSKPESLSGILNWALEGLKKYRQDGLSRPKTVREAIARSRDESDKLKNFMDECLESSKYGVSFNSFYQAYAQWARECGYYPEGKYTVKQEMEKRNLLQKRGTVYDRITNTTKVTSNVLPGFQIKNTD